MAFVFETSESTPLCELMGRHGSDKGNVDILNSWHNYTTLYHSLFKDIRKKPLRVFELGLGTNNVALPSNMGADGKPGASLRGWRDYFPHAAVFGADIDRDILFEEDRIQTFFCDQTNPGVIAALWETPELKEDFDIMIDDGLHAFAANLCFLENSLHKLRPDGYYVIEDILASEFDLFAAAIDDLRTKFPHVSFDLLRIPSSRNRLDNNVLIAHLSTKTFTCDITPTLFASIDELYEKLPTGPMTCVEIGSFEGRGSLLIAQLLCKHEDSRLYCIDPFDDEYVKGDERMAFWDHACKGQKARFYNNVKNVPSIVPLEGTSDTMIPHIPDGSVDFVYIDGDHSPEQVYKDAVNMLGKMKKGGVMLFDDYGWEVNGMKTADGIHRFLGEHGGRYEILLRNWQLAIRILS